MKHVFETILKYIIGADTDREPLAKINISGQFLEGHQDDRAVARNLNAAFLVTLSGETHPLYNQCLDYFTRFESHPSWGAVVLFYRAAVDRIQSEILGRCYDDAQFENDMERLYSWLMIPDNLENKEATIESVHRLFFPEGVSLCRDREEKIRALREKRTIRITGLNPAPLKDPAREVLFTANVLVTVPPASKPIDTLPVISSIKFRLEQALRDRQLYWYDHPVPIGVPPDQNEVLYGLEGLDRAVAFEKQRGTIDKDAVVTCLLSVSVTHKNLQNIVKDYIEDELRKEKNIRNLDVYIITEADAERIVEQIFIPALGMIPAPADPGTVSRVFGVDGEYGRHYSFLKAIAAYWQTLINPEVRGTFKIDLDQVFPQAELVEQSGRSAFEHFKSPLWGAEGEDSAGNSVELGMIAGALVNQKDIGTSLYTPDVCFPACQAKGDELIFFSALPQALSTEAEMMTRYSGSMPDGINHCIQRIHVTGGTSGILIDALRKYRPFTPTFIGRAEDQAYLLSVLFSGDPNKLRYVHMDGLFMRHDKEAFAGEAIKLAASGKIIGDYVRMLLFSYYAKALPWSLEEIKDTIDPFTGCFVSRIPLTVVYLRFALKAASLFAANSHNESLDGLEFINSGVRRLDEVIGKLTREPNLLIEQYEKEKEGWRVYYEVLEKIGQGVNRGDPFARELAEKAKDLMQNCRIHFK
ncbi:MAG: hypothetical protein JSU90_00190 [Nitrospiraceae bacterium]|nr:MAG: hypothetical protein JSU90_00190 [Nitrospiraceae bacterium]